MSSQLILQRLCRISPVMISRRSYFMISSVHCISGSCVLKSVVLTSPQVRTFWESFPYIRPLLYEKDGLNRKKFELIYHSGFFNYAFYAQLVSLFVFCAQIFGGSYYAYQSYVAGTLVPSISHFGPYIVNYDSLTLLFICVFTLQNFALYFCAQSSVLRVYYNDNTDEFVVITLGKNPFKSRLMYCKPGELMALKGGRFEFLLGNHELDGKRLFIKFESFRNMYYYNKLIGENY